MRPEWTKARRIVVKIGSALLVDRATGASRRPGSTRWRMMWLRWPRRARRSCSSPRVRLRSAGASSVCQRERSSSRRARLPPLSDKSRSSRAYQDVFRARGLATAQVLLTLGDTEERRRYLNARSTIATLLKLKAVPVVNENDTVATSEIRYGDNDRLAARVASMASADCLVLLSDIDGLYTAPPSAIRMRAFVEEVRELSAEFGHGGRCRHRAVARRHGDETAGGPHRHGGRHAYGHHFGQGDEPARRACQRRAAPRGFWRRPIRSPPASAGLPGPLEPKGTIVIDDGAAGALEGGKSLLPAGVRADRGRSFERGDAVAIRTLTAARSGAASLPMARRKQTASSARSRRRSRKSSASKAAPS